MSAEFLAGVLPEALALLLAAGWLILLVAGVEPDKPLSGGLPGHEDLSHDDGQPHKSRLDRVGEMLGWLVFGSISLALPLIVIWILRVHG